MLVETKHSKSAPALAMQLGTLVWMLVSSSSLVWSEDISDEMVSLSLEDFLSTEVESVSKRGQDLMTTPASVYVMDGEDIRRTGATRLQDVLKRIPGVYLGDLSYDETAMMVRDIPQSFTSTVLVLLDRVPIQRVATGGFTFRGFDLDISEIEKIEVIKGPGATVYGANATTGVISIYTKSADNNESAVRMSAGSNSYVAPSFSGGKSFGENQHVRGWMKYQTHDGYSRDGFDGEEVQAYSPRLGKRVTISNRLNFDVGELSAFSFGLSHLWNISPDTRVDSRIFRTQSKGDRLNSFPTEYPDAPGLPTPAEAFPIDTWLGLGVVSTRFTRQGPTSDLISQLSYSREAVELATGGGLVNESNTLDFEIQEQRRWGSSHVVDVGAAGRYAHVTIDRLFDRTWIYPLVKTQSQWLYSGFVQDRFELNQDITITAGLKAEIWSLVGGGPEWLPSLRANYQPRENLSFWAGTSRAVTTQGIHEATLEARTVQVPPAWVYLKSGVPEDQVPAGAGKWVALLPSENPSPTEYWTHELGTRFSASNSWRFDFSTFASSVVGRSVGQDDPNLNETILSEFDGEEVIPIYYANATDLFTFGGEAVARYQPSLDRRLEVSYSMIGVDVHADEPTTVEKAPKHNLRIGAFQQLSGGVGLQADAAWTSKSPSLVYGFDYVEQIAKSVGEGGIVLDDRNTQWVVDLTLSKQFQDGVRLKIWGKNLLNDPYVDHFPAFNLLLYPRTVERTFGISLALER